MAELFERLADYFRFPFVRYALIVGVLIALCAALLGVTLVLKRFSFIGDGLSHVAFGAMAVAAVTGLTNQMVIVMPVTILCAVLLLKTGRNARVRGDASIAMLSVGALALGYLLMNLFPVSAIHVIAAFCLLGVIAFLFWRWRKTIGNRMVPFAVYAAVLGLTTACAIGGLSGHTLQGQLIALGGALFYVSDAFILGRLLFTADRSVDWAVMILYYSAQLLIGVSCLV